MAGTRIGGKKAAKKIGRESLAKSGRKGGQAKVKKGFAVSGKAREAGSKGGQAKAGRLRAALNKLLYGIAEPELCQNPTVRRTHMHRAGYSITDKSGSWPWAGKYAGRYEVY